MLSAIPQLTSHRDSPDGARNAGAFLFAEFFAGIGLMRAGLEPAGWRVVFANDNDPQKLEMYEDHFGPARAYYRTDDIRRLRGADVPDAHLVTASFPCNDLSLAGSRAGLGGEQSSMFYE